MFAHFCGIRPWEIDLLTVKEFEALCEFVDKANEDTSKGG